jgi:hypothetical protein
MVDPPLAAVFGLTLPAAVSTPHWRPTRLLIHPFSIRVNAPWTLFLIFFPYVANQSHWEQNYADF